MKLLVFADIHELNEIPNETPDMVVILGNVTSKVVAKLDKHFDCTKVGLLSNRCHSALYDDTSFINIHGRVVALDGIRIAGFGGAPKRYEDDADEIGFYSNETAAHFLEQLEVSNVDVLLSYTNLAYGDVKSPNADSGFKAYNQLILKDIVNTVIHGRLYSSFQRKLGRIKVHSVYPYSVITIKK